MSRHETAALILQGQSGFNALSALNGELARALDLLKVQPILLDLTDAEASNRIFNQAKQDFGYERLLAVFSFSGIGIEAGDAESGGNLWQRLKLPVIAWLLDHPAYHLLRNSHPAPAIMRLYGSRDFVDFQRDYVRAPLRTGYCPQGTMGYGREARKRRVEGTETPLVIFPKSGGDPEVLENEWKAKLPALAVRVIREAIDHYWEETRRSGSVAASVLAAADGAGMELRNDLPLLSFFVAQTDQYIRDKKTALLLRDLSRFPVRIHTQNPAAEKFKDGKASILPPIDYGELINLFHEALAIVTVNPNVDDLGHDRIFSAFGCGALPVSDVNPWWQQRHPELLPYSYDFRDRPIAAAMERIFADPASAAETAWQEGEKMRASRPFAMAVAEAMNLAQTHRYFTFNYEPVIEGYVRFGS